MATTAGLALAEFDLATSTIVQLLTAYEQSVPAGSVLSQPVRVGLGDNVLPPNGPNLVAQRGVHITFVSPIDDGLTPTDVFANGTNTTTVVTDDTGLATITSGFTTNGIIGSFNIYAYSSDIPGLAGVYLKIVTTPLPPSYTDSFYVNSLNVQIMYGKGCDQGRSDSQTSYAS